jgi:hypothetical protein
VDTSAVKRALNDRLRRKAALYDSGPDPVPFLCECGDPLCRELVRRTVDAYGARRDGDPLLFPGHQATR